MAFYMVAHDRADGFLSYDDGECNRLGRQDGLPPRGLHNWDDPSRASFRQESLTRRPEPLSSYLPVSQGSSYGRLTPSTPSSVEFVGSKKNARGKEQSAAHEPGTPARSLRTKETEVGSCAPLVLNHVVDHASLNKIKRRLGSEDGEIREEVKLAEACSPKRIKLEGDEQNVDLAALSRPLAVVGNPFPA